MSWKVAAWRSRSSCACLEPQLLSDQDRDQRHAQAVPGRVPVLRLDRRVQRREALQLAVGEPARGPHQLDRVLARSDRGRSHDRRQRHADQREPARADDQQRDRAGREEVRRRVAATTTGGRSTTIDPVQPGHPHRDDADRDRRDHPCDDREDARRSRVTVPRTAGCSSSSSSANGWPIASPSASGRRKLRPAIGPQEARPAGVGPAGRDQCAGTMPRLFTCMRRAASSRTGDDYQQERAGSTRPGTRRNPPLQRTATSSPTP